MDSSPERLRRSRRFNHETHEQKNENHGLHGLHGWLIRRVPTKHTNYANGKELYPKLSRRFACFVGERMARRERGRARERARERFIRFNASTLYRPRKPLPKGSFSGEERQIYSPLFTYYPMGIWTATPSFTAPTASDACGGFRFSTMTSTPCRLVFARSR